MILIASNRNKNNLRRPKSRKDKSKKKIIIIINVILYNLVNLNEQIKLKLIDIVKKKRKKLFEEIHRHRYKVKHILFSVRCNCWVGFQLISYRYKVKHILWEMCYCLVTGVRDVLLLGYRYKVKHILFSVRCNCWVGFQLLSWYF